MARISIYVPDERKPEVDAMKDRLNLSQIFMAAFDRSVKVLESKGKLGEKDMQAIIDRLRIAKERDFEQGWKDGAQTASLFATKHLRYSDIRRIAEGRTQFGESNRVYHWLNSVVHIHGSPEFERGEIEDSQLLGNYDQVGMDVPIYLDGFDVGFVEQITNIWNQIQDKF